MFGSISLCPKDKYLVLLLHRQLFEFLNDFLNAHVSILALLHGNAIEAHTSFGVNCAEAAGLGLPGRLAGAAGSGW
jgi:hypothetical protein